MAGVLWGIVVLLGVLVDELWFKPLEEGGPKGGEGGEAS